MRTNLFQGVEGKVIPDRFSWFAEPSEWEFRKGQLRIIAPEKSDFFFDPRTRTKKFDAPFLFTEVVGDFTLVTKVKVDMKSEFDSGCMMIVVDDSNWAKLCYEYSYRTPSIVSVVTREVSDDCNSMACSGEVFLRVSRFGQSYAFHYSQDGKWWHLIRHFGLTSPVKVRVGVVAQSPSGEGCLVEFSGLEYSPEGVRDIRSGV